jgi:F-type H+-transporting ATPase subunit b
MTLGRFAEKARSFGALALGLLAAMPHAVAQEHGASSSGGMPQLDPSTFAPQLFWLVVTFLALYWVMSKVALPRVGGVIANRATKIASDLDQAAKLKAQAEEVSAAYQKALADARAQATALNRETAAKMSAIANERQAKLAADLGTRIKAAEAEIANAKTAAMMNLVQVAGDAAASAAHKLVGLDVTGAEAALAAQSVLAERG